MRHVGEKFLRVLSLVSRIPSVWLIVVSMLYGLAQLAFVDPGRFPSTDESIYIAEVSRFADRIAWGPQRARGITLVVAPIVQLTAEMTPLRIYMVVVSSGALFGVFLIWCRLVWWASPLAAGLFASSWVVTYYGSEVMPNLYSALAAVGAVGMLLLYARSKSTGSAVGIVAFFAGMALFRPFDAAVVFAGVCAAWLIVGRPWPVRALMTAACGLVLGIAPWIVEAWIRFGGLGAGVDLATSSSPSLVGNITDYLLLLDGPLRPPDDAQAIAAGGLAWVALLVLMAVAGLLMSTKHGRVQIVAVLAPAIALGLLYLTGIGIASPRYMLPAFALLCVASGIGMIECMRRVDSRPVTLVFGVVLVALVTWNLTVVQNVDSAAGVHRAQTRAVGEALRVRASPDGECYFLSQRAAAEISLASGCRGDALLGLVENFLRLADARASGSTIYVVSKHTVMDDAVPGKWTCNPVTSVPISTGWRICETNKA